MQGEGGAGPPQRAAVRRSLGVLIGVAALVFALDRWTKRWASASLPFNQPIPVIGDYLRLTYTRNSGVAFGIGQGTGFPYYLFSLLAAAVILWLFLRHRDMSPMRRVALSLIFGGALGNLVDRLNGGEVVDFIEIGVSRWHWPVFNVADMAVTSGVALFALTWAGRGAPAAPPDEAAGAGEGRAPSVAAAQGEDDRRSPAPGAGEPRGGEAGPLSGHGAGRPLA